MAWLSAFVIVLAIVRISAEDAPPEFLAPDALPVTVPSLSATSESLSTTVSTVSLSDTALSPLLDLWLDAAPDRRAVIEERMGGDPDRFATIIRQREQNGAFDERFRLLSDILDKYRLMAALGSDSFVERQAAEEETLRLRQSLEPAINAAQNSANAQLRVAATVRSLDIRGRGFLGIQYSDPNQFGVIAMGQPRAAAPEPDGCVIATTVFNMPADLAGIKGGDVLVRMNDRIIRAFKDVVESVAIFGPQRRIVCSVRRDERIQWFILNLADHHNDAPVR
ncbi:MAG: hypothetical protein ABIH86_06640 [Planctomycetota bacterium]